MHIQYLNAHEIHMGRQSFQPYRDVLSDGQEYSREAHDWKGYSAKNVQDAQLLQEIVPETPCHVRYTIQRRARNDAPNLTKYFYSRQ
jgi:hypothetical protein